MSWYLESVICKHDIRGSRRLKHSFVTTAWRCPGFRFRLGTHCMRACSKGWQSGNFSRYSGYSSFLTPPSSLSFWAQNRLKVESLSYYAHQIKIQRKLGGKCYKNKTNFKSERTAVTVPAGKPQSVNISLFFSIQYSGHIHSKLCK